MFLEDKFVKVNRLDYTSRTSRRVVRSVLGSEVFAFSNAVDAEIMVRNDSSSKLNRESPLRILTYSTSLFNIITKSSTNVEKRLIIDISVESQDKKLNEITKISGEKCERNLADSPTKCDPGKPLFQFMDTRKFKYSIGKIARKKWRCEMV